jgi:hypothetical protein
MPSSAVTPPKRIEMLDTCRDGDAAERRGRVKTDMNETHCSSGFPVRMFRRASERPATRFYRQTPTKRGTRKIRIDEFPNATARQNTPPIARRHFAAECFGFMAL